MIRYTGSQLDHNIMRPMDIKLLCIKGLQKQLNHPVSHELLFHVDDNLMIQGLVLDGEGFYISLAQNFPFTLNPDGVRSKK